MKRTNMASIVLFVVCLMGYSQGAPAADNEGVALSRLPAVVQEVVKREFPGAIVSEIEDGEYEGIDVYEIEGKSADGMDFQLEIGKDGTLYQKDEEVRLQDLPPAVLAVVKKELRGAEPDNLKRLTEHGRVVYELDGEVSGKDIELKIGADGTILEKEGGSDAGDVVSPPARDPTAERGSDELPQQFLGPDLRDKEAPDGIVGWWKMDDIKDGKVIDSSGKGNHGEIFGICEPAEGFVGSGALKITGGGVTIPDSVSLRPSMLTVCGWIKIDNKQVRGARVLEKGHDNNETYNISGSEHGYRFSILDADDDTQGLSVSGTPFGQWYHFACTYDGSDIAVYVNGKVRDKKTFGKITPCDSTGEPLVFGNRPPGMERPLNALIDDFRVYERALTADEVWQLYAWKGGDTNYSALPEPADESGNIMPDSKIKWMKGVNAESSVVYFGTDQAAVKNAKVGDPEYKTSTSEESFDPGQLEFAKNYFWRIDSAVKGKILKGEVWVFSTAAGQAENPTPDPLLKNVDTNVKLTWEASSLAKSHDVYFGDDPDEVANATTGSKAHKGTLGIGKESFDPGKLGEGKYYYWRVDENCAAGTAKGDIWKFRTKGGGLVIQVDLAVKTCDKKEYYPGLAKPGWTIWASDAWTDMYMHDYQVFPLKADGSGLDEGGINGTGVTLWMTTGNEGQLGIGAKGVCRDNLGGGGCPGGIAEGDPIANSWAYGVDWVGPYAGDLLLVIRDLPAGVYELYSYHNFWEPCTQKTRNCLDCVCGMPPMPAITANPLPSKLVSLDANGVPLPGKQNYKARLPEGTGKGVKSIQNAYNVAPQHVYKDSELVPSVIKFSTDGSDVLVIYQADRSEPLYPDCARPGREGARGILNAFELIQTEAK